MHSLIQRLYENRENRYQISNIRKTHQFALPIWAKKAFGDRISPYLGEAGPDDLQKGPFQPQLPSAVALTTTFLSRLVLTTTVYSRNKIHLRGRQSSPAAFGRKKRCLITGWVQIRSIWGHLLTPSPPQTEEWRHWYDFIWSGKLVGRNLNFTIF